MFKITAIVSLILIATWSQAASRRHKKDGSSSEEFHTGNILAAGLSCDSCGSECASACGTRQFRSCCFNYLRKKRGPDTTSIKVVPQYIRDLKAERIQQPTLPMIVVEEIPRQWLSHIISSDFEPYGFDDTVDDNRLQALFDV